MKIAPPSADLLIKLALAAVGVGVVVYAVRKLASVAGGAYEAVADATKYVNPTSPDNVAYQTVNAVGGAVVSNPAGPGKNADGSWTFGGWIYDVTH